MARPSPLFCLFLYCICVDLPLVSILYLFHLASLPAFPQQPLSDIIFYGLRETFYSCTSIPVYSHLQFILKNNSFDGFSIMAPVLHQTLLCTVNTSYMVWCFLFILCKISFQWMCVMIHEGHHEALW